MEPTTILRSDALDILFENRNKEYGAYNLRRNYPQRLLTSLAIMAGLVFIASIFLKTNQLPKLISSGIIHIDSITLSPPPVLPPPPATPPPSTPPAPKAASQQFVKPEIVPDHLQKDPLPEMEELTDKMISTETIEGPAPDGITRPPVSEGTGPAAPIEPPVEKAPEILKTAAVMPSFPGGIGALQRWLSKNLRPQDGLEPGNRIKVVARFVVDVNGHITGIQLSQTGGDPYDQEVLRVIKKMPKWNPGQQNGQSVAVWFTIPIIFESQEE